MVKLDDDAIDAFDHAAIFAFMTASAPAAPAEPLDAAVLTSLSGAMQKVVARAHESLENDAPRKVRKESLSFSLYNLSSLISLTGQVGTFGHVVCRRLHCAGTRRLSVVSVRRSEHTTEFTHTHTHTSLTILSVLLQAVDVAANLGTLKERAKEAKITPKALKKLTRCAELLFCAVWPRLSSDERAAASKRDALQELRREAVELRWKHRALHHAACTLDGEPVVVLHPGQKWGARVLLRGVSDNAQLHFLLVAQLLAALPAGKAEWSKPNPSVMAVFTGEKHGDLAVGEIEGVFNMYNWFALDSNAQLTGDYNGLPNSGAWVWVQGTPSDIDVCDALPGEKPVRVVLLGPCPYTRRIPIARDFVHMKASLEVQSLIAEADVKKFVDALAAVDHRIKLSSCRRVRLETNVGRDEVEGNEVQLVPAHLLFGPAA